MPKKKKSTKRYFENMNYREVQCANTKNRNHLDKNDQQWLKTHGYKNIGWDNVINLYRKIEDFLEQYRLKSFTLEELFLEADHVGNKYMSNHEIYEFNQILSKEVNEIAEIIDKQFPDDEIEIIDYSHKSNPQSARKNNLKIYKTIKI